MTHESMICPVAYAVCNPLAQFRSVSQWTGGLCCEPKIAR